MTSQDQIKALAELDGWKFMEFASTGESGDSYSAEMVGEVWLPANKNWETMDYAARRGWFNREVNPPNYLTSYDAIIPLIQKSSYSQIDYIIDWCNTANDSRHGYANATPQQLSKALLRATGKWKESEK